MPNNYNGHYTRAYLTIHAHFYQPPRENPWTEEIDREPSASPFHNWNERINEECYRANAFARIFAEDGRVLGIHNNFNDLSFNVGPTIMSWMRQHAPDVYERIKQGDAAGLTRWGHGNAIAQGYNHIIMPLASRRDKVTQTRWAIDDFIFHFGRDPEALWLPETAVDTETLEVLAEHGLKFAILAPRQAARVRPLSGGNWTDVSQGNVDPSWPYLCRLPSGRSIALFFYDGPISHDISFGDTLSSSANFMRRLADSVDPNRPHPQLIHFASDGETYGHHRRYAERTLAYAMTELAGRYGFETLNYGAFLERFPPQWEVEIVENSSWSCAHGVERWRSNCGCHTGGQAGWHQLWREPLRTALDNLRTVFDEAFVTHASAIFSDPWAVRDAFGQILPRRQDPTVVADFFSRQAGRPLNSQEQTRALVLLEMQRQGMLMYASCGWFFNDVSGIETAQVLKYAAHGIDLLTSLGHGDPTDRFMRDLLKAPSNVPDIGTAARVYQTQVLPTRIGPEKVAASYALHSVVAPQPLKAHLHAHWVEQLESHSRQIGEYRLVCGYLNLVSDFTQMESRWVYSALYLGGYNVQAAVVRCSDPELCAAVCTELEFYLKNSSLAEMLDFMRLLVHPNIFSLPEIPPADRRRLLSELDKSTMDQLSASYERIYSEHLGTIQVLREAEMRVPDELRVAAEYTLSHRLKRAAERLAATASSEAATEVSQISDLANHVQLSLDFQAARAVIEQAITRRVNSWQATNALDPYDLQHVSAVIEKARGLGFLLDLSRAQEGFIALLEARPTLLESTLGEHVNHVAEALGVSPLAWQANYIPQY